MGGVADGTAYGNEGDTEDVSGFRVWAGFDWVTAVMCGPLRCGVAMPTRDLRWDELETAGELESQSSRPAMLFRSSSSVCSAD
jgi:hypothetical protein